MVMWGAEYLDLFLRVVLPTHLSPGNLPALPSGSWRYRIYAPASEAEAMRGAAAYGHLARLGPVDLLTIPPAEGAYKYRVISDCHGHAIREAVREGAALVFLAPDAIFADGAFGAMHRIAGAGKRVIVAAGIRVRKESFVPAALADRGAAPGEPAAMSPRTLVGLALRHLHPISDALCWGGPTGYAWPSHLYWRVGEEGLLARCFHLHPVMVYAPAVPLPDGETIDGTYLDRLAGDPGTVHVVTDSDEIAVCEISRSDLEVGAPLPVPLTAGRVAAWARVLATSQHRRFFRERIRVHAGDLSPAWQRIERDSDRVVGRILALERLLTLLRCYDAPLKPVRRWLRPWKERWGLR
jgi:hypothetical protein